MHINRAGQQPPGTKAPDDPASSADSRSRAQSVCKYWPRHGAQRFQFQKKFSLPEFLQLYGTEKQCEPALAQAGWPDGFRCPRCNGQEHELVHGRRLRRYQCRTCGDQVTGAARSCRRPNPPLTTWFLAFYLIGQAKTGTSSLALSQHLGVNNDTAWLLHNKTLRAMSEGEKTYILRGKIQPDDTYLGGERPGGKTGRGSENNSLIVAAVSLNEAGHPVDAKITPVLGFSSRQTPKRPAAVRLDQHHPREPQGQPEWHPPQLRFRQVHQALPGQLLLPLCHGGDDRGDCQRRLLLHAMHGARSQGRGGFWVIKRRVAATTGARTWR